MTETALETTRRFSTADLRAITDFDSLGDLFREKDVPLANVGDVLGDGFSLLSTDQKKTLEGEALVILDWQFTAGENGEFVTVRLVTREGSRKLIVNDGSTGIRDQVKDYAENSEAGRARQPLYVPRGLRRSDYSVEVDGKTTRATTYYLDTASRA